MKKQRKAETALIPQEYVESKILLMRDKKVIVDRDLATLYGVDTKVLKQAVRRNIKRFPSDFMFELTKKEFEDWRSQFVTSKSDRIGLRYKPMVFTEPGVAMLSSVLNSERAIQVNIQIMRAFIKLREMLSTHIELKRKIGEMEKRHAKHDEHFQIVFKTIKEMLNPPVEKKGKIGFRTDK